MYDKLFVEIFVFNDSILLKKEQICRKNIITMCFCDEGIIFNIVLYEN